METSQIHLYQGVELTPDFAWTIDFESSEDRDIYFNKHETHEITSTGYKRIGDRKLRVYAPYEALRFVNYLRYTDRHHITIYAFITNMIYINENTTEIEYEVDYLQTYADYYTLEDSFVEREHQDRWRKARTNNQGIKYLPIFNTKVEPIDYGQDYKMTSNQINGELQYNLQWCYVFTTKAIHRNANTYDRFTEQDVPTGYFVYATAITSNGLGITWNDSSGENTLTLVNIKILVECCKTKPEVAQIVISNIPPTAINKLTDYYFSGNMKTKNVYVPLAEEGQQVDGAVILINSRSRGILKIKDINNDDILPSLEINHTRDKDMRYESKLFTFPYNFQKVSYGNNEMILKREYTNYKYTLNNYSSDRELDIFQSLSSEATSIVADKGYQDNKVDGQRVLVNATPAIVDLTTDEWLKYMLANKSSRLSGITSMGLGLVGGIASSGAVASLTGNKLALLGIPASIIGGASQILSLMAKESDIKNQPTDNRTFTGDLSITKVLSNLNPILVKCDLFDEYKKQVYDYLYHYGYKCNEFKKPNLNSRYYFNYIKTVDANIKTKLWGEIRDKIKEIYDKGITIWHYHSDNWLGVNQYDKENAEVSLEV